MKRKYFKAPGFGKSQAALEFLTTYAWAFLVILIMIGALAYFGVLRPTQILPDRCTLGAEIGCVDYQISATANTLSLRLKNNIGEPIVLPSPVANQIAVSTEANTPFACTLTGIDGVAPPLAGNVFTWNTGAIVDFAFTGCNTVGVGFVAGDKGKVFLIINYHLAKTSTVYTRQVAGEVFSTIV